ncbi:DUF4145 domain-containing protein [Sphingopyxis sp.]|jgi:hypothetical protein|uniref:DUF4145 domain-containing protein n=1 Tax=Sphingopyxis sp. TaxID=1908224 RepID=UPI002DE9C82E|nr:DUF4145 domain-containing protein [Sphingopyxis sp.]
MNEKPEFSAKKAGCSSCGGSRNCDVLGHFEQRGGDDFLSWITDWYLLRCRGCEHTFVQTVGTNSEDYHDYYDEEGEHVTHHTETIGYWPALSKRQQPDWLGLISVKGADESILMSALAELYTALNNDLFMLAGIGIRTSFDAASELLGIDPEITFREKLNALVDGGHIGKLDLARLEALVDAGSASAHRGWKPNAEDLDTMMELLEHFLHEAFVTPEKRRRLDAKAAAVKGKVPVRKKAQKTKASAPLAKK